MEDYAFQAGVITGSGLLKLHDSSCKKADISNKMLLIGICFSAFAAKH